MIMCSPFWLLSTHWLATQRQSKVNIYSYLPPVFILTMQGRGRALTETSHVTLHTLSCLSKSPIKFAWWSTDRLLFKVVYLHHYSQNIFSSFSDPSIVTSWIPSPPWVFECTMSIVQCWNPQELYLDSAVKLNVLSIHRSIKVYQWWVMKSIWCGRHEGGSWNPQIASLICISNLVAT